MPNHITNKLKINADKDLTKKIKDYLKKNTMIVL